MVKSVNFNAPFARFCCGSAAGLFFGAITWSYSAFAHVVLPPMQRLAGLAFFAISFGAIAFLTDFDNLMDQIPPF